MNLFLDPSFHANRIFTLIEKTTSSGNLGNSTLKEGN